MSSLSLQKNIRRLGNQLPTPVATQLQKFITAVKSQRNTRRTRGVSRVVKSRFSTAQQTRRNADVLHGLLTDATIEHVIIPTPLTSHVVYVLSVQDLPRFIDTLRARHTELETFRISIQGREKTLHQAADHLASAKSKRVLHFYEAVSTPESVRLHSSHAHATVQFWDRLDKQIERPDGGHHELGTVLKPRNLLPRTVINYLRAEQWEQFNQREDNSFIPEAPLLYRVTEPVDVVYTWVDGADPAWQERRREALGLPSELAQDHNETAFSDARFTDHDELRYSLRSLEMNADWVRHIYIVTDGQVPHWLRTDHPRITIVSHHDIFSDTSVLPVYNSHAIESQLHHIADLSEQFLYLNDDTFFGRPTEPELFFISNGMSKFFRSKVPIDLSPISLDDLPVTTAAKNNRSLIQRTFNRTVTQKFKHTPQPLLKSVIEEMELKHPSIFSEVSARKLRHPEDYSIPSSLYHYYAYCNRKATVGSIRYDYIDIGDANAERRLIALKERRDLDVFCLNDTGNGHVTTQTAERLIDECLKHRFPIPSSFEL